MYSTFLSVLLLGMWPLVPVTTGQSSSIARVAIAPPTRAIENVQKISASGAIIIDAKSGQVVYSKYADTKRPMASITKLMTALIIAENHELDEIVKIPSGIDEITGNRAYLAEGESFTVGDMLSALLIASGNDAAEVLAEYHSGSTYAFAAEMNERAAKLGLQDTSFANPSGLDNYQQYSTPRDIAWLTSYVMRMPEIAERMEKRWDRIYSLEGTEIALNHTHAFLHSKSPVVAGKTGTTGRARQCLVSVVDEDDRKYIVVLMHSDERYEDMRVILDALDHSPNTVALQHS